MAEAAAEEDPDDGVGFGREMGIAIGERPDGVRGIERLFGPREHGGEREACEAKPGIGEKRTPGDARTTI